MFTSRPTDPEAPRPLRHVILIPDGNGRWAQQNGLPVLEGHRRGAQAVERFLNVCQAREVHWATVWAFSTENWQRSRDEVGGIMRLVRVILDRNRERLRRNGIRFRALGRRDRLRREFPSLVDFLEKLERETLEYRPFNLNVALDYGGRDEIVRALQRIVELKLPAEQVTAELIAQHLDTAGQPDPDLILRTSGEQRLSGIMPFQSDYAELCFLPMYLPEMQEEDVHAAFDLFQRRERRFGARPEQPANPLGQGGGAR